MTNPRPSRLTQSLVSALCFAGLLFTAEQPARLTMPYRLQGGGWALCRTADRLAGTDLRTDARQG